MTDALRADIPAATTLHLCVDMQRLFAEETPWHTPWMQRIADTVAQIAERHASRTIFTRFIPPRRPSDMPGRWQAYYLQWREMTLERLSPDLLKLIDPLASLAPPARIWDKPVYSPFFESGLHRLLQSEDVNSLVITGGETDVCVLATVLDAIDHGYRIILPRDALCSSSDSTHEALMKLYQDRFSHQIEVCGSAELLASWRSIL